MNGTLSEGIPGIKEFNLAQVGTRTFRSHEALHAPMPMAFSILRYFDLSIPDSRLCMENSMLS